MRRVMGPLLSIVIALPLAVAAASTPHGGTGKSPAARSAAAMLKTPVQSLVSSERDFAKMAREHGTRAAFLANLADDAVTFQPLPVNGHDSWQARPPSQSSLAWEPAYAEVAAAGDLGFTSGPWEFNPPAGTPNAQTSYGDFLSVWRRTKGGWKVALDVGASHDKPDVGLGTTPFVEGPEHEGGQGVTDPMEAGVLRTFDLAMSRMVASVNASRAVIHWAASDLRYLHDGDMPRTGDDARNALAMAAKRPSWKPTGFGVAASGDLGYTYGVREDSSEVAGQAPDSSVYVHVWRRADGDWKIAAAVENPLRHK